MRAICGRAGLLVAVMASTGAAQELRGFVRDSVNDFAIGGAVVMLVDSAGNAVTRDITDARGAYRVMVSPAARAVRFLRLGYRMRQLSLPQVFSDGQTQLDAGLLRVPQLLDTIVVVDQPQCPVRPDRGTAFALWQQARTALLATLVAQAARPAQLTALVYQRRLSEDGNRITSQQVQIARGRSSVAFGAAHRAERFVKSGFLDEDSTGEHVYHGPDAEVLLDDEFQRAYCFSLAPAEPERPTEIGLRFAPVKHVNGRLEIDGALWIDTSRLALHDIVYRYLGLEPETMKYRPGGHIEFYPMPNGVVLLHRWSMRLAGDLMTQRAPIAREPEGGVVLGHRTYTAAETGGEVADATWSDRTSWHASLGAVRIHLTDGTGRSVPNVRVKLDGTDYAARSDSTGVAEIQDLLPGPYTAFIVDSSLAEIFVRLETTFVFEATRDSTHEEHTKVASLAEFIERRCRGNLAAPPYFVARVMGPDGRARRGVQWQVGPEYGTTGADGIIVPCHPIARDQLLGVRLQRGRDQPKTYTLKLQKDVTAMKLEIRP